MVGVSLLRFGVDLALPKTFWLLRAEAAEVQPSMTRTQAESELRAMVHRAVTDWVETPAEVVGLTEPEPAAAAELESLRTVRRAQTGPLMDQLMVRAAAGTVGAAEATGSVAVVAAEMTTFPTGAVVVLAVRTRTRTFFLVQLHTHQHPAQLEPLDRAEHLCLHPGNQVESGTYLFASTYGQSHLADRRP